jgi:NAD(P)-dependent dehydrogenase (short-subunit alcohol dehydrogenase family)
MLLKGQVALVTGGGTGIGLAIAQMLLRHGAEVAIASRNRAHLDEGAAAARALGHTPMTLELDVTNAENVAAVVDAITARHGSLDILINNAGINGPTPVDGEDNGMWSAILATNLTGPYYCAKRAAAVMRRKRRGRIINMSSVLGRFGVPGYSAYCAAKHGIIGFTKALALELVGDGITVNALCPTWVDTAMARQILGEGAESAGMPAADYQQIAVSRVPMKRMVEASEVAELALFLCSDAAASITGQAINICGGATAGAAG